jgi:uncharacterized protein (TIGR02217 family)
MTVPTFPTLPGLAYPVARKPMWRTDREESFSGIDTTYPTRSVPKWNYELQFSVLRSSTALPEWQQLASFFNSLQGANNLFKYVDPMDSAVTDQPFGTGDGVTTAFQLVRTGPPGGGTFTEPVYAPVTITNVKVAGTPTGAYALGATGIITFSAPPANGAQLLWTGTYAFLCYFDKDEMAFTQITYNLFDLQKISFTTQIGF